MFGHLHTKDDIYVNAHVCFIVAYLISEPICG